MTLLQMKVVCDMSRITMKDLEGQVNRLNRITNSPMESYTKLPDGKFKANIGNYHLDGAYGGWKLGRICSEGGGVSDILSCGYVSKREIYQLIYSYIRGIENTQDEKSTT